MGQAPDVSLSNVPGSMIPGVSDAVTQAIHAIGDELSSGGDPADVIRGVLGVVRGVFGADVAAVNRVREGELTIVHAACDEPVDVIGRPFLLQDTVCSRTWGEPGPLILEDGDVDLAPSAAGGARYRGYAGRTLTVDGMRWGTVAVWSTRPLLLEPADATLLVEILSTAVVGQLARVRTRLLFRELETTAKIGAWSLSLETGKLWWSDEVYRVHGLEPGSIEPCVENAIDFYHSDDRTTIRILLEHAILTGEPWDVRLRLITSAGETRWVRARGQRLLDAGVPAKVVGTFEDIHDHVLDELEREQMRSRLEHAIHGSNDGLWDWADMDRDEQWWSPRFLSLLGISAGDLPPGQVAFLGLVHPDERADVAAAFEASRTLGEPFEHEFRLRVRDVGYRWFLGRARISMGVPGRPNRMAGSIQDIDERRRIELLLQDRNREIKAFLHAASHDLKSPMLTIDAFSEQIEENAMHGDRSEILHAAGRVRAATTRMQSIVRDLLTYGRAGHRELVMAPVEVGAIVGELRHQLAGHIDRRTVAIETQLDVDTVWADRSQMCSLLQNLLTNALEHGLDRDGRGRICVRTEAVPDDAGRVRMIVSDDGPGVDPEHFARIFEPFARLRAGGGLGGGTGLGLAIVEQIATEWKGRVWVESSPGRGAAFIVDWPGRIPPSSTDA